MILFRFFISLFLGWYYFYWFHRTNTILLILSIKYFSTDFIELIISLDFIEGIISLDFIEWIISSDLTKWLFSPISSLLSFSKVHAHVYVYASEDIVCRKPLLIIIIRMKNGVGSYIPLIIVPYHTKTPYTVDIEITNREVAKRKRAPFYVANGFFIA